MQIILYNFAQDHEKNCASTVLKSSFFYDFQQVCYVDMFYFECEHVIIKLDLTNLSSIGKWMVL